MTPRPMISRAPGTRATRMDTQERRLESLAAEFALLAQRRARMAHQISLLDQQRRAATDTFARLQARMFWLSERMQVRAGLVDEPAIAINVRSSPVIAGIGSSHVAQVRAVADEPARRARERSAGAAEKTPSFQIKLPQKRASASTVPKARAPSRLWRG